MSIKTRKPRIHLNINERKVLVQLCIDCRTYGFNHSDSITYINKRLGKDISYELLASYNRKLEKGILTNEWLSNFAKVGFALVHQELFTASINSYKDTNRKIQELIEFIKQNSSAYKNQYKYYDNLLIQLKELQIQQGKEVMSYTLGTPVIAQIKAMVRQEIVMQHRQKLLEHGETLEDSNYAIMKNILHLDKEKGNLIIQDAQKYISNPDDSIQRSSEEFIKDREISDTRGQDTNTTTDGLLPSGEQNETRINPDTNYTIPNNTDKQKEYERLQQAERDAIF